MLTNLVTPYAPCHPGMEQGGGGESDPSRRLPASPHLRVGWCGVSYHPWERYAVWSSVRGTGLLTPNLGRPVMQMGSVLPKRDGGGKGPLTQRGPFPPRPGRGSMSRRGRRSHFGTSHFGSSHFSSSGNFGSNALNLKTVLNNEKSWPFVELPF